MRGRILAAALALLAPAAAQAHPHMLIDAHVVIRFEAGKIAMLQMGWKFDPISSSALVQDYDKDKSGTLSAQELAELEKEAFQDTRQYGYFTYAMTDGTPVTWPAAEQFQVMTVDDSLLYAFRLRLPQPVDPRRQAFRVSTYEETYYIDIDFPNDAAIQLIGDGAAGCHAKISPDLENRLFGGVVIPKKVEITCDP